MLSKKLMAALARAAEAHQARACLELAEGEVVAIGKESGSITLAHAGIPGLSLPPMTMVFATKQWILLDSLKPGDTVRFKAIDHGDSYVVTVIEST
ncbi:MAG: copper-binding protein [Burkholderiales bacterium]|nr:copper-binding protein [Burkholderiales bacterium]